VSRRSSLHAHAIAALLAAAALSLPAAGPGLAQGRPIAQVKAVLAPKHAGAWLVNGWGRDGEASHCSAERSVDGILDDGGALQFGLVRLPDAYRIFLGSNEWQLSPGTAFPVELIAPGVFRSEANAVAVGSGSVIIELGGDTGFVQQLATAPNLEIKAAKTVFRLPLEDFSLAVAEVDSCLAALKLRSSSNPVAPARPATTTAARTSNANSAAPVDSRITENAGLIEERTFLTVRDPKGSYRLEAVVVRPAQASGRLPIVLITHGKNFKPIENQTLHADWMLPQARDFAARGWLAAAIIRRGYGDSDGVPGVSRGAAYMACGTNGDLAHGFSVEADDLAGALAAISERPDADASRVLVVGQSFGGGTALAFASRQPAGLLGVINVSGGVFRTGGDDEVCDWDGLVDAMRAFGGRTRVPTLWLYAENDHLFGPLVVNRMHEAYVSAGGQAELKMFPAIGEEGHGLFSNFIGRTKWLPALDAFLVASRMPNANIARLDEVKRAPRLAGFKQAFLEEYLAMPLPKALAVSVGETDAYWYSDTSGIEAARAAALKNCHEQAHGECTLVMDNNDLLRPLVTSATTSNVTAR
jgi:dienelactone hydrolase